MLNSPDKEDIPKYWDLLSDDDKREYLTIFYSIRQTSYDKKIKKDRLTLFTETIDLIRKFVFRESQRETARSLICGVFWCNDKIAVNCQRLGILMSRCKSTINNMLQMIGYKEVKSKKDTRYIVSEKLSSITNNKYEIRKWSLHSISIPDRPLIDDMKNSNIILQNDQFNFLQNQQFTGKNAPENNLVSIAPIKSEDQGNDQFKENIIIYEAFQSINQNKIQNNDSSTTEVFFC